jgi:hypothetical protein
MRWLAPALLAVSCAWAQPAGRGPAGPCDRACLDGFTNQYLDAVVARSPLRLQWNENAKYIENGIELKPGEGLWKTATGLGAYKLYFADAKEGQAGFFGTLRENARPVTVILRLKIENRKVTEAEAMVSRDAEVARSLEKGSPDPTFSETVAESSRISRQELSVTTDALRTPLIDEERQIVLALRQDNAAILAIRNRRVDKTESMPLPKK